MNGLLAILIFGVVFAIDDNITRFDNFKVYRVIPSNAEEVDVLKKLEEINGGYSFWTEVSGVENPVDIMVSPHMDMDFKDAMSINNIQNEVFIKNVQTNIDNERSKLKTGKGTFDDYMTLDQIYSYLKEMQSRFPEIVTLVVGGSTYERRNITGVHISFNKENENRAVFLEGGIHAREWISPATVLYMMTEILTSTNTTVRSMALAYDWYVFPSFNPDGYVYTHKTNRLWRKTRKPYGVCVGSDPNRNWGFHWNEKGASRFPCADTYSGSKAFSEVETKSMANYISSIQHKLIAYIAFHSYSQMLLIPYGHSAAHLENYNDLYSVGIKATQSLTQRYGTKYSVGNIVEIIYAASGGSMDWVKGNYKTPITYTYELRDQGRYGFILPADQIIPTGEETFDSLITILTEFEKIL